MNPEAALLMRVRGFVVAFVVQGEIATVWFLPDLSDIHCFDGSRD